MNRLVIASGNTLRRDDGVAHRTLELLDGVQKRSELQLNPELAEDVAGFDQVIFLDADAGGNAPRIVPIDLSQSRAPFTHHSAAEEIVRLARSLYGFNGTAWLCRIPAKDFGYGEGLSPEGWESARQAAALVRRIAIPSGIL